MKSVLLFVLAAWAYNVIALRYNSAINYVQSFSRQFRGRTSPSGINADTRMQQGSALISGNSALNAGFGTPGATGANARLKIPEDANDCPCGSGKSYSECCKAAHQYRMITSNGADLIRARFSAYAIGDIDFIIETSSEQSPDHQYYSALPGTKEKNFKRWGRDINTSMMKDYFFVKVEVDSETLDEGEDDVSTVVFRHLAIQKGTNVMYPIQEKATLVRDDGVAWKYVLGEVGRPDPEKAQEMMENWPKDRGMTLNKLDRLNEDELDAEEKEMLDDEDPNEDPRVKAAGMAGARVREGNSRRSNPYGGPFAKGLNPRKGW